MLVAAVPFLPSRAQDARALVVKTSDVRYATHDNVKLRLDVYRERVAESARPSVLVIAGGAWKKSDKDDWSSAGRSLARQGFVVFVPDVRLACKDQERPRCGYGHPAPVKDLRAAIRWVHENAADYNARAGKIGALGASSGGHLAQYLGTTGTEGETKLDAVVSWSGPSKLSLLVGERGERSVKSYIGCSYSKCRKKWRRASPIHRVTPNDAAMYLINSRNEFIPAEGAKAMADKLRRKGVPHRLTILEGDRHGAEYAKDVIDDTASFLKRVL